MSNNLAGIFNLLLAQPQIGVEMQRRILAQGIATRDYALLARLASHPSLDTTVDDGLRDVNSALVKTAWVNRKGRTPEQIIEMVRSEKRVTVLTALVQSDGLPADLYQSIVDRTENPKVLAAVQENSNIPENTRFAATRKQIAVLEPASVHENEFNRERLSYIRQAISRMPAVAPTLFDTQDPYVLVALAHSIELPDEVQVRAVTIFRDRYAKILAEKKEYRYYNNPLSHILELVEDMIDNAAVCDEAAKILDEALEATRNNVQQGYMQQRVDVIRTALGQSKPRGTQQLHLRYSEIDSTEAMTAFVEDISRHKGLGKLDFPERLLTPLAIQIVGSPHATPGIIREACDWLGWGSDSNALVKAAGLTDSAKIAAVITGLHYVDVDEVLDRVDHPLEVMELLLQNAIDPNGNQTLRGLMDCKHFSHEMLLSVPLRLITECNLDVSQIAVIDRELAALVTDENSWTTFITLAEEYEGSFLDLVKLAQSL
jgi:hypothetical protein